MDGPVGPARGVTLREVEDDDLPIFFRHQLDAEASRMAAFTPEDPSDRDAFEAHWAKIRGDESTVNRTILVDGEVVGYVASFERFGRREVSYWIDRARWGRGIATEATRLLLAIVRTRPIYARAARENAGSIRVLEKCGFVHCGSESAFAHARGMEIEEVVMRLD